MVWDEDGEKTEVGNRDKLVQVLQQGRTVQRAYVIVLAGPNTGEMFKLDGMSDVGRGQSVRIRLMDTEISRRHARFVSRGGQTHVEDLGSTNGTFVNGAQLQGSRPLRDGDKIQIGTTTILKFSLQDAVEEQFQKKMYDAALRDGLTGAYNKQYFAERIESELAYAHRHRTPLALVMFDLDHFKRINDTWGHLAGDYVLKTLSGGVLQSVRKEDVFARYGGEEFAMLSRGLNLEAGVRFAERLRAWVESYPFVFEGTRLPVTTSLGVAAHPEIETEDPKVMIKAADEALYASKSGGRNRVSAAGG